MPFACARVAWRAVLVRVALSLWVLLAASVFATVVPAQGSTEARFGSQLKLAKDAYARISGKRDQRASDRVAAVTALDALTRASKLAETLSAERMGFAQFGVHVWRSMVYWRLGQEKDLQMAVELGLKARQQAHAAGAYDTFYRALLLVVLWNSMGTDFLDLLEDPLGDGDYLRDEGPKGALQQLGSKQGWREMVWSLRILRAGFQLRRISAMRAGTRPPSQCCRVR